jgi:glutathione S-transferase
MRLIGMLDSPYVRRVAISLRLMGLAFDHESVSVFRAYDAFAAINPVVKAPTLVTDAGVVLMDSSLILEHLERLAPAGRGLNPVDVEDHARAQRIIGLALAACEKTVQLVYEFNLRPEERRHQPWIERVREQLGEAYRLLEVEVGDGPPWLLGARPSQAGVTAAVAWSFTGFALPKTVAAIEADEHPALADLARRAESLPEFLAAPIA